MCFNLSEFSYILKTIFLFIFLEQNADLKEVICTLESEQLKRFVNTDEFKLHLETHSPKFFNKAQLWKFVIGLRGANCCFVWPVKQFLTDLINDWSPARPLDLVDYVPVVYEFDIRCHHLEIVIPVNQYNYVDCIDPIPGFLHKRLSFYFVQVGIFKNSKFFNFF